MVAGLSMTWGTLRGRAYVNSLMWRSLVLYAVLAFVATSCTSGRIVLNGREYTTVYDFSLGLLGDDAPNEFAKLDEFAKSILESIWECQSSSTIEILSCHGAEAPSN